MEIESPINNTRGRPGTSATSTSAGSTGFGGAPVPAAGSRLWAETARGTRNAAIRQKDKSFMTKACPTTEKGEIRKAEGGKARKRKRTADSGA